MKRLYRSRNQMLAGVCAGVAEYFDIDPTLVRLGYALLLIATGFVPMFILYIIAAVIVPQTP